MDRVAQHVQGLRSGSTGEQQQAAGALRNLAADNAANQAAIAAAGAIEPLVALVRSGSVGAQEQAAAALWALATGNAANKAAIVAAGAIEPLTAMRSGSALAAMEQAEGALGVLAEDNADAQFELGIMHFKKHRRAATATPPQRVCGGERARRASARTL